MALRKNYGDYNSSLSLSPVAKMELHWWLDNIDEMSNWIHPPTIVTEIFCDASNLGWGTVFDDRTTGCVWNYFELDLNINVKEILAIYYAIRSYAIDLKGKHVKVFTDDMVAVKVINKIGTSKSNSYSQTAQVIWQFCKSLNMWITCAHIPGSDDIIADKESRKAHKETEIYKKALKQLQFTPNLDCFATRISTQLDRYVSYKPDPYAFLIDAFTVNWQLYNCYLFPPFSIMGRVLRKIQIDQAEVILVAPL